MSNKYGIPEELYPRVQSIIARLGCTDIQREWVLKTHSEIMPWCDPLMPAMLAMLVAIHNGETAGQKIEQHLIDIEEMEHRLISTVKERTEAIKTESQAVDESLKLANDEFSRKITALIRRFEKASKATIATQKQLIQMHSQLKVRSRTTLRGQLSQYATALAVGLILGLYLPHSPLGDAFMSDLTSTLTSTSRQ